MHPTRTAGKPVSRLMATLVMVLTIGVHSTGTSGQTNTTWKGGSGKWSDATKWTNGVPNVNFDAFIDAGNPLASLVTMDINPSVVDLTVDADDTLIMPAGSSLFVNGNIANAGSIAMGGSGFGAALRFASPNRLGPLGPCTGIESPPED